MFFLQINSALQGLISTAMLDMSTGPLLHSALQRQTTVTADFLLINLLLFTLI